MREYNWLTEREVSFHLGGPRGAWAPSIFGTTKTCAFSTNSQSRFAPVVLDGILRLPSLSHNSPVFF